MAHIAKHRGQSCVGAAPRIVAAADSVRSIPVQPALTLDQLHAVIVNESFRVLQLHYHIGEVYPEVSNDPGIKKSYGEAFDFFRAMFERLGASAARASVTLDV